MFNRKYSIDEKKKYYSKMLNSTNKTMQEKAKKRLRELNSINAKNSFGKVFVAPDALFNPKAHTNKSRRVVYVTDHNNLAKVIPVRKFTTIVPLSKFDGNRHVNVNLAAYVKLDDLYEVKDFSNTGKDYLTNKEKALLKTKI